MPSVKPNIKAGTQKVVLTTGDETAFKTVAATCKWLAEHDKCAAAKDAAINLEAVLKHYEKPAKAPKDATAAATAK